MYGCVSFLEDGYTKLIFYSAFFIALYASHGWRCNNKLYSCSSKLCAANHHKVDNCENFFLWQDLQQQHIKSRLRRKLRIWIKYKMNLCFQNTVIIYKDSNHFPVIYALLCFGLSHTFLPSSKKCPITFTVVVMGEKWRRGINISTGRHLVSS